MSDFLDNVIAAYACGEESMRGVKEFSRLIWFTVKNHSQRYVPLKEEGQACGEALFSEIYSRLEWDEVDSFLQRNV
ncbi:hypothetical protein KY290_000544 [Solanum tuberosum]|uniref:Uncharacterized protein n=1 Tax=Solanum tuberosum TaxID=4113 RepID=A0ABQ7WL34_SOLTU|nr:hypothetical protein KY285_000557 [Solanum tuberosum]KAH0780946.1 hypothetical protein KY290_000544 [Solanum tuberosum]